MAGAACTPWCAGPTGCKAAGLRGCCTHPRTPPGVRAAGCRQPPPRPTGSAAGPGPPPLLLVSVCGGGGGGGYCNKSLRPYATVCVRGGGRYDYKFEPALDQLVDFTLYKPEVNFKNQRVIRSSLSDAPDMSTERAEERKKRLSYHSKQMILQQIATKRAHLEEGSGSGAGASSGASNKRGADSQAEDDAAAASQASQGDGTKRKKTQEEVDAFMKARMGLTVEAHKVKPEVKTVAKDFFGRALGRAPTASQTNPGTHPVERHAGHARACPSRARSCTQSCAPTTTTIHPLTLSCRLCCRLCRSCAFARGCLPCGPVALWPEARAACNRAVRCAPACLALLALLGPLMTPLSLVPRLSLPVALSAVPPAPRRARPSRRRCTRARARARSCRVQEEHVHADNDALQLQVPGGVFKRGQAAAAAGGSGHALEANAKSVHHSAARWQPAG